MNYKFTDDELEKILSNIVVIVDTREKENKHITKFFNDKKINYIIKTLDFGDYSCMIPEGTFKGQERDIFFDRDIAIERKACIDELANNFKDDAVRIKTELAHLNKYEIRCYLFIEDPNYDINIRKGNYRSKYKPKALYNRIKKSIELRYKTLVRPISKEIIGSEIYNTLEAFIYEVFKNEGFIEDNEDDSMDLEET